MAYCGIDVSNKSLDVTIKKQEKFLKCIKFNNTHKGHLAVLAYLIKHKVTRVGIEATGYYHLDLAVVLNEQESIELMIINPRASKHFAKAMMQSNKNDAIDSRVLALFVERMDFVKWVKPQHHIFAIRACGRRLISLSKEKTKAKNHLHAFSKTKETIDFIIDDIQLSIQQIQEQIDRLIAYALELIHTHNDLELAYKRVTSIKGVADITAIKLLGELGILASDMSAKQWVAHAGLFPKTFESGSSVKKKTTIGKSGNRYIREALYMGALSASRYDKNIRADYLHLIQDNGLTKLQAICAVMRKILVAMHRMLATDKDFEGQRFYKLES